jgi:hypothetical protein
MGGAAGISSGVSGDDEADVDGRVDAVEVDVEVELDVEGDDDSAAPDTNSLADERVSTLDELSAPTRRTLECASDVPANTSERPITSSSMRVFVAILGEM